MTFEDRLSELGVDLSDLNYNVGRCADLYEKYYERAKAMADERGKKGEFVAALMTSMLLCDIAERDDIIDRMETRLDNVTGELDYLVKICTNCRDCRSCKSYDICDDEDIECNQYYSGYEYAGIPEDWSADDEQS